MSATVCIGAASWIGLGVRGGGLRDWKRALLIAACLCSGSVVASTDPGRKEELRQMVERGSRFEHAEGLQRDLAHAHSLYCRAAREGSTDALVRLGWMYANGRGVPRDDATAQTLFKRAGALGSELAQRLSGVVKGTEERLPECLTSKDAPLRLPEAEIVESAPPAATDPVVTAREKAAARNSPERKHGSGGEETVRGRTADEKARLLKKEEAARRRKAEERDRLFKM